MVCWNLNVQLQGQMVNICHIILMIKIDYSYKKRLRLNNLVFLIQALYEPSF